MSAKKGLSQNEEKTIHHGVCVELEHVMMAGHDTAYQACEKVLKEKDIELTPSLFAGYCFERRPAEGVAELLRRVGRERLSDAKLAADIQNAIQAAFAESAEDPASPIVRLLTSGFRGFEVSFGAVSLLDTETADASIAQWGLSEPLSAVTSFADEGSLTPGVDAWRAISRSMRVAPELCVAVATSASSCKAALAAGMNCIALPSKYTDYQDFGGCDAVVRSHEELIKELPNILSLAS